MFKAFLIDDEENILIGMQEIISWEQHGFTIAGTFSDSAEAMAAALRERPELIITDIEMPGLSGLDLAEELRQRLPEATVVILSAHDRFSYAQRAIQSGVFRYLLKPIDSHELQTLLEEVRRLATRQLSYSSKESEAKKALSDLRRYQEQTLLRSLVSEGAFPETPENEMIYAELAESCVCRFYFFRLLRPPTDRSALRKKTDDLINACRDFFRMELFFSSEQDLVLLQRGEDEGIEAGILPELLSERVGIPVALAVTAPLTRLRDLHACFRLQLRSFREAVYYCEPPSLLTAESTAAECCELEELQRRLEARLQRLFFSADPNGLSHLRADLYNTLLPLRPPRAAVRGLLCSLLAVGRQLTDMQCGGALPPAPALPESLSFCDELRYAFNELENNFRAASAVLGDDPTGIIGRMKFYIHDHYADPTLSLREIALLNHMNYSYLSSLFRRSEGVPFFSYLSRVRIGEAEKLLEQTSLSIPEIAKRTGYQEMQTFYTAFKKYSGCTPKQYRDATGRRP